MSATWGKPGVSAAPVAQPDRRLRPVFDREPDEGRIPWSANKRAAIRAVRNRGGSRMDGPLLKEVKVPEYEIHEVDEVGGYQLAFSEEFGVWGRMSEGTLMLAITGSQRPHAEDWMIVTDSSRAGLEFDFEAPGLAEAFLEVLR